MQVDNSFNQSGLPQSAWRLCISLTTGALVPHEFWHSKKFRAKFFLRSVVMPLSTHNILKSLIDHPCYETLLFAQPRLPCRLHRPYLSSRLKKCEGFKAIKYHYKTVYELIGEHGFKLHLNEGILITNLVGKSNEIYSLIFNSTYNLDREGESSLILQCPDGKDLCMITFTLYEENDERNLIVGGLQGLKHNNAQELTQLATKDLFGVFPKKIVYEALIAIAKKLKVKKIKGVSNKNHVYQALRYNDRKRHFRADYNSAWEMLGGVLNEEGYYDLPSIPSRKDINEIPSKKRSEYRKRYGLLDEVKSSVEILF